MNGFFLLRKAITTFCQYHPNHPVPVSPQWIVSSTQHGLLQKTHLFPPTVTTNMTIMQSKTPPPSSSSSSHGFKQTKKSNTFQGAVFTLVRFTPPEHSIRFDSTELEQIITSNGGLMLTSSIVEALKKQQQLKHQNRVCFVVSLSGGYHSEAILNSFMRDVSNQNLCQIVPVTPIWIRTCIDEKCDFPPTRYHPTFFRPHTWSLKKALTDDMQIAVTGFVGIERTGILHAIRAMGAIYTENLKPTNTHLIIKSSSNKNKGPKWIKAIEWNLHIVTLEWLHHIIKYGFIGQRQCESGCEHLFSPILIDEAKTENHNLNATINTKSIIKLPPTEDEKQIGKHHIDDNNVIESKLDAEQPKSSSSANDEQRTNKTKASDTLSSEDRLISTLKSLEQPLTMGSDDNKSVGSNSNSNHNKRRRPFIIRRPLRNQQQTQVEDEMVEMNQSDNLSLFPTSNITDNVNSNNQDGMVESQAIWYGNQTQHQ